VEGEKLAGDLEDASLLFGSAGRTSFLDLTHGPDRRVPGERRDSYSNREQPTQRETRFAPFNFHRAAPSLRLSDGRE